MAKRAAAAKGGGKKQTGKKGGAKAGPTQGAMEGMSGGPPMQVPTNEQIVSAFSKVGKLQSSARSAAGLVGAKVNDLVENQNFDKKALSTGRGLWALPDERFRIVWTHLKKYAEAMEFDKRADAQYAMFEEGGQDAQPGAEGETDDTKVTQLRQPRSVGETAGAQQH